MYSPKIPERLIPPLYRLGQAQGRPMTHLVAEAVERYLAAEGWLDDLEPADVPPGNVVRGVFDGADERSAA
ncbi:MAG: hypothetical protein M0R75_15760 [Dehalococcoidia bacterium]|nr:hypothetical protein [Dehalococcoidia bacterium]